MIRNIFRRRILHSASLFNGGYIDPKALFVATYDAIPSVSYLAELDIAEAVVWLRNAIRAELRDLHQHAEFNSLSGNLEFNTQLYVLNKPCIIEVGPDFVSIYHDRSLTDWVRKLLRDLSGFRIKVDPRPPIGFGSRREREN
jgi:hypothetical protein